CNYFRLHERTFQFINPNDIEMLFLKSKDNLSFKFDFSLYKTSSDDVYDEYSENDDVVDDDYSHNAIQLHYVKNQSIFKKIPGNPFAFWLSKNMFAAFEGKHLNDYSNCCTGMHTGNNDKFVRYWFEVNFMQTSIIKETGKYKRYNCGGDSRKWYGNHWNVINWGSDGKEIRNEKSSVIRNERFFGEEGISWKRIGSKDNYFRYLPKDFIFDQSGDSMFPFDKNKLFYLLGFLNSIVAKNALKAIAPTINLTAGNMSKLPIIYSENALIESAVEENIKISKFEWDSYETSWDFTRNALLSQNKSSVKDAFIIWESITKNNFEIVKSNEINLNKHFIKIYSLEDELEPDVSDKDVIYRIAELKESIKELISYAVGCMFGRYSLDVEGIVYAGGEWVDDKYKTFLPDKDNCIPITDEEYFEDDIVGLFVAFVKKVYGIETLEENLDFIAKALGNKGDTSREVIRNYFVKDFYKDHLKIYQKRPIYWLYDSGKQDGFKALIYMHRYNADTTGIVRVDYLHKMQKIYMGEIDRMQDMVENSTQAREISQAEKRKEKLIKQLKETKEYDEKIAHIALSRIDIDLDDGIKVNYEKVQTGQDGKKFN
ncbi:MAG: BREX-1 system adenine-specific DNA-methyltransferase PglX, partial [Tissierellia bacterium]|nr:BREX-1 system adenine-specific DNA-methyltransferase PglX [Tissierellia bacterium]